jgi:hypothetical protein
VLPNKNITCKSNKCRFLRALCFCVDNFCWEHTVHTWLSRCDASLKVAGTNPDEIIAFILIYVRPPLWSIGQSSPLQIQKSGFDFRSYQIFWEVLGLERGPPSLVNTIEELLEKKTSGSGLDSREYFRRDPSRRPRVTLYPQKLLLTSPTSGNRSIGIVRYPTQATEFLFNPSNIMY